MYYTGTEELRLFDFSVCRQLIHLDLGFEGPGPGKESVFFGDLHRIIQSSPLLIRLAIDLVIDVVCKSRLDTVEFAYNWTGSDLSVELRKGFEHLDESISSHDQLKEIVLKLDMEHTQPSTAGWVQLVERCFSTLKGRDGAVLSVSFTPKYLTNFESDFGGWLSHIPTWEPSLQVQSLGCYIQLQQGSHMPKQP